MSTAVPATLRDLHVDPIALVDAPCCGAISARHMIGTWNVAVSPDMRPAQLPRYMHYR